MAIISVPRVGRVYGTGVPLIEHFPVNSGAVPKNGDLVVLNASGEVTVCGDDPASILGIMTNAKAQKAGYGMANSPSQVQHRDTRVGVAVANDNVLFAMPVSVDGSATFSAVLASYVGVSYGIKLISTIFFLNIADTTGPTLKVIDVDLPTRTAFCLVVPAARQLG
jgi:hypothetical protein